MNGDSRRMIRLTRDQFAALLDADWREDGPIRLNENLTLADLRPVPVLNHARLVLRHVEEEGAVKLTAAGKFNRKFVARMVDAFRWPGFERDEVWRFNKVLNEDDFIPLNYLHAILDIAGLLRKYKGTRRLGRLGRSLLAPDAAGALNALLFDTTFNRFNLTYLDRWVASDDFQPQAGLTFYLMSRFEDVPRTAEEWMTATTLPPEHRETENLRILGGAFRARILRYLEWFGLMEELSAAANDEWAVAGLFRKTPLFDDFLSFRI